MYSGGLDGMRKFHRPYIVLISKIRPLLRPKTIVEIKTLYSYGQKYGGFPAFSGSLQSLLPSTVVSDSESKCVFLTEVFSSQHFHAVYSVSFTTFYELVQGFTFACLHKGLLATPINFTRLASVTVSFL